MEMLLDDLQCLELSVWIIGVVRQSETGTPEFRLSSMAS
jgi:hypothetical protein